MDNLTKRAIKQHVERIIDDFRLPLRSREHPDECPYYTKHTRCHAGNWRLNCYLCYCPEYDTSKPEGGCKINNPRGKWFDRSSFGKEKIWDCSDCDFPNRESTVRKYLRKYFGLS